MTLKLERRKCDKLTAMLQYFMTSLMWYLHVPIKYTVCLLFSYVSMLLTIFEHSVQVIALASLPDTGEPYCISHQKKGQH